jgi:hypothetical protein
MPGWASRSAVALLPVVPSESLDRHDDAILGACFAGQSTVSAERTSVRVDYRSRWQSGSSLTVLRLQLWKSSPSISDDDDRRRTRSHWRAGVGRGGAQGRPVVVGGQLDVVLEADPGDGLKL